MSSNFFDLSPEERGEAYDRAMGLDWEDIER